MRRQHVVSGAFSFLIPCGVLAACGGKILDEQQGTGQIIDYAPPGSTSSSASSSGAYPYPTTAPTSYPIYDAGPTPYPPPYDDAGPPLPPPPPPAFDAGPPLPVTPIQGSTDPGPNPCADPSALPDLTSTNAAPQCHHATHVANAAKYTSPSSIGITDIVRSGVAHTTDGSIDSVRPANANPYTFEVWNGIGFVREKRAGNPDLAIWSFGSLDVEAGVTVEFVGDAAVVLLARAEIFTKAGSVLDVSAHGIVPGPGGFAGGTFRTSGLGCGPGGAPSGTGQSGDTGSTNGGGGGGGLGSPGGNGGDDTIVPGGGGPGGEVCTFDSTFANGFFGGSGGGGADTSGFVAGPFGGGGGGAIQLTAFTDVHLDGSIRAGGGGGRTAIGNSRDGAGGGSGGTIFIETPNIRPATVGVFAANGGGGGSASSAASCPAYEEAQDGQLSMAPALGGRCAFASGGAGGSMASDAKDGATDAFGGSGGGGGGYGRFVIAMPNPDPEQWTSASSPTPYLTKMP